MSERCGVPPSNQTMLMEAFRTRLAAEKLPRQPATILVVGAGRHTIESLAALPTEAGHRVLTAAHSEAALDIFCREPVDVVLVDQAMLDGELLPRLRALADGVPIILLRDRALDDGSARRQLMRALDLHGISSQDAGDHLLDWIESALASGRRLEQARAAQELRGLILTKFCHELRSALHVIRGYTDILQGERAAPSAQDILERLGQATDCALGLAQDYLDLARLDAPGVNVRQELVNIDALLADLRALSGRQIGARPVRFTTAPSFPGAFIATDGEKLRAILAQLLANAVKFTLSGEIRLTVQPRRAHTEFVLADSGPGIPADELPRVLTPFRQLRDDPATTAPGQGVGLAIALRLSALIGATLTANSDARAGAMFTLSVPAALTRAPEIAELTLH